MSRQYKVPLGLVGLTSDPSETNVGTIYYNTVSGRIRVYTDTGWTNASADLTAAGNTFLYGTVNPSEVQGNNGDIYLNINTLQIFKKVLGTWGSGDEVNVYIKAEVDQLISDVEAIALAGL